ncbi:hypothetical protein QTN56_03290 [Latilactobacillus sakei]|uniref:hypothetical protein n=1 Tax=Latilactobacillus sakei TaxID=1599 RepID=UPI0025A4F1FE|nr:hypothetical protein [Latilactobacillus sakei]MDM5043893.1 hypothetical protein [Latilactobacillus sakei]
MSNPNEELIDLEIEQQLLREEELDEYQKIVRAGVGQWVSNFKNGQIKLTTANDLKILLEAEAMINKQR